MPKSFLISRRRKLGSSTYEPPRKSSRVLRTCSSYADDEGHTGARVSRNCGCDDYSKEKGDMCPGKDSEQHLLVAEHSVENRFCTQDNIHCLELPLEKSSQGLIENEGNNMSYFPLRTIKVEVENFNNSCKRNYSVRCHNFENANIKKDSARKNKFYADYNNNKEPEDYCGKSCSKCLTERKGNYQSLVGEESKPACASVSNNNISHCHEAHIHPILRNSAGELVLSPAIQYADAKTDKLPGIFSPEKTRRTSFFLSEKHSIVDQRTELYMNVNESPEQCTALSKSVNTDSLLSKQSDVCRKMITYSEEEPRPVISDNSKSRTVTSLMSDVNSVFCHKQEYLSSQAFISSPFLLDSWRDNTAFDKSFGNQKNCTKHVCDRDKRQHEEVETSTKEQIDKDQNGEVVSVCEQQEQFRHRRLVKAQISSLPQSPNCPRVSNLANVSSLSTSPRQRITCECVSPSEPAQDLQNSPHKNNIFPTSKWCPTDRVLSSLLHRHKDHNSPVNKYFREITDSGTKSQPEETRHSSICLPARVEVPFISPLHIQGHESLQKCQEANEALGHPGYTKGFSNVKPYDTNNNEERSHTCQKFLSAPEPLTHLCRSVPVRMNKWQKRPIKSFMISSIISDLIGGEQEEKPSLSKTDCSFNTSSEHFCKPSGFERIDDTVLSSARSELLKEEGNASANSIEDSPLTANCSDIHKQKTDFHHLQLKCSNLSPSIVSLENEKLSTALSPESDSKHKQENVSKSKHTYCQNISTPLTGGACVNNALSTSCKDCTNAQSFHNVSRKELHQPLADAVDESSGKCPFHEIQTLSKSPTDQYDYFTCHMLPIQKDLFSNGIQHTMSGNVHTWPLTVKGIYNPMPMRVHPMSNLISCLTPAMYTPAFLSTPTRIELGNPNISPFNASIHQRKNSFLELSDATRHSPECDVDSVVSSVPPLATSSSIPSPTASSNGSNVSPVKFGSLDASIPLAQIPGNNCPKAGYRFGQEEKAGKLEISESKNFKSILEQRNVKLEYINGGYGIKNPLLNTQFAENKLGLPPSKCSLSCPVCNSTFDLAKHLQRHLKTHREIKRFLCSFCGKGFNDTFDLKRHTRTHTGIRPYKCNQCDKAFTQRCSLESHCKKIHGLADQLAFNERRIKLYVCEVCGHSTDLADEHYEHSRHAHPSAQVKRRVSM